MFRRYSLNNDYNPSYTHDNENYEPFSNYRVMAIEIRDCATVG